MGRWLEAFTAKFEQSDNQKCGVLPPSVCPGPAICVRRVILHSLCPLLANSLSDHQRFLMVPWSMRRGTYP